MKNQTGSFVPRAVARGLKTPMTLAASSLLLLLALGWTGCTENRTQNVAESTDANQEGTAAEPYDTSSTNTMNQDGTVAADNTGVNVRDRNDANPTAGDQAENPADRKLAQEIRKAIVDDSSLSMYAHNIKIIARGGKVTLRGPVKNESEKTTVGNKARDIAGQDQVDNQLEVAG